MVLEFLDRAHMHRRAEPGRGEKERGWGDHHLETLAAGRSIRPVFLLTAGRALAFAVTFATPLVLVRIFDQAEFGIYKQLFVVYATFAAIAQLGMA